ncbi:MAG: NUDIX domain-containing protein [Cyanobacteria bacterium]|nr:NUDIX domain-containing protein [Cyanobacteriota bacterium]
MVILAQHPKFASVLPPNVKTYAKPAQDNGTAFLRMYTTQPEGFPHPWGFAHRERGKGAVHTLTVMNKPDTGEENILLIIQKRPPFGGKSIIELPAGLVGDENPNETAKTAGPKEVREELGFEAKATGSLASNAFATSPGMTTEQKWFSWVQADGIAKEPNHDASEKASIQGSMMVPVSTFSDYGKFKQWLLQQEQNGMIVGLDVIAARGLMPPVIGGKVNFEA